MSTGTTLSELEWSWFAERSGLSGNNRPLSDHKHAYFSSKGFGGTNKPITQMEKEWLQSVAGTDSEYFGDLWREACVAQSVPVGATMHECKRNFFRLVTGSP